MKRLFHSRIAVAACALVALSVASPLYAQSDYSNRMGSSHLTIGPGVAFGASMAVDASEGSKIKPIFAWHGGVDASYPLTPTIGTTLSLGLESRGTEVHPYNASESYADTRIQYFSINPGFTFSAFYLGINFALPLSGSTTYPAPVGTREFSESDENKMNTLIEPRIGAIIPVMDSMIGWLAITLTAGISLDEFMDRGEKPAGMDSDVWGNYQNMSLYLGTTFQLAIPGTGKK
jgi:hypothetical protein